MKIKVLHIIGGPPENGAYKGAYILHKALLSFNIDSKILNDMPNLDKNKKYDKEFIYFNNNLLKKYLRKIFILLEKIIKSTYLPIPRSTYTLGLFGYDITKFKEYKNSDIIHIHWLSEGFINFRTLFKTNKTIIWTMRDMWPFTGGSHYTMDFENFEKSFISKIIKNIKKKSFKKNIQFVAISNWLKKEAEKSNVLEKKDIITVHNNIDLEEFKQVEKNLARSKLDINTKKHVMLFGAQNTQATRKGWIIFLETLKKLDKNKYFILIFGNFWSQKILDDVGFEYKSMGFINDNKKLSLIYSSADFFVFPSLQEAFGKTWAESLACKTPVVCFENTAASEFIDHKSNGYICNAYDPQKLKDGIEWLSNEFNHNSLKKIPEKVLSIDAKIIAKKYIEIYLNALNKKKN